MASNLSVSSWICTCTVCISRSKAAGTTAISVVVRSICSMALHKASTSSMTFSWLGWKIGSTFRSIMLERIQVDISRRSSWIWSDLSYWPIDCISWSISVCRLRTANNSLDVCCSSCRNATMSSDRYATCAEATEASAIRFCEITRSSSTWRANSSLSLVT